MRFEEEYLRGLQANIDFERAQRERQERQRIEGALEETAALQEIYDERLSILQVQQAEEEAQLQRYASRVGDNFGEFLNDILDRTDTFGENLRQLFIDTLVDIRQDLIDDLITDPITDATAGFLRGFLPFGNIFGRQLGGPVQPGQPFLVGERGPELFVPTQSGNISPTLRGSVVFNQNFSFSVSTPDDIRAVALSVLPEASNQSFQDAAERIGLGESLGN